VIALIDYGAGNLTSVRKAIAAVGAESVTPSAPDDLRGAAGVIIPGVGHFGATRAIDDRWRAELCAAVDRGVPLLGVCLGLQFLFDGSDEAPDVPGLGLLPGRCALLRSTAESERVCARGTRPERAGEAAREDACRGVRRGEAPRPIKVPHVGWNEIRLTRPSTLLSDVADGTRMYFTHSYAAPVTSACVATTDHAATFASAVEQGAIFGVQFHPEKSADAGLRVLRAFVQITKSPDHHFTKSARCSPSA
jgi:glutamine amidotransferase